MIITISGTPGSGKTTIAQNLADRLNYKHYSVGGIRGQIASNHGLTIDKLNKIGEREAWTDKEADELTIKMGKEGDNFVIDGRLAYHFIPHSYKIFLKVDEQEAAKRIFKNQRKDEEKKQTIEQVLQMIKKRHQSDHIRYQKYYGLNFEDEINYDFILDTTNFSISQVTEKILQHIKIVLVKLS